jgi:hypothetical protein
MARRFDIVNQTQSRISSLTRFFEGGKLYRRGCEYLYGTNGYGEKDEFLSEHVGFSLLKAFKESGHSDAEFSARAVPFNKAADRREAPISGRSYIRSSQSTFAASTNFPSNTE